MSLEADFQLNSPLAIMKHVFESRSISYWVDQGTLLGLVRDGRPLAGDNDIDISVWFRDVKNVRPKLVAELRSAGLEVGESYLYGLTLKAAGADKPVNISYLFEDRDQAVKFFFPPDGGGNFLATRLRKFLIHLWQKLDGTGVPQPQKGGLAYLFRRLPWKLTNGAAGLLTLGYYLLSFSYVGRSDRKHFAGSAQKLYGELVLPIPLQAEAYLTHKYGLSWRVPQKDWSYWKDDGSLLNRRILCGRSFLDFLLRRSPYVLASSGEPR